MIFIRNLLILVFLIGCTSPDGVKPEEVKRIIEALSSDEMQGRKVFTESIDKAASFIANEFKQGGLVPVNETGSYFQSFDVESASIEKAKVQVNNVLLDEESYFIRMSDLTLHWSDSDVPNVQFIRPSDDFRTLAGNAFSATENTLVVVSLEHKNMFNRYRSYIMRPRIQMPGEPRSKANVVFVLLDTEKIEQLSVEAEQKAEKKELKNVVGKIEGKRTNEFVLFSGHYDHLGVGRSVEGDSIYNGANDDASGVTAVVELAKHFEQKGKPERTLLFVAFTAEEVGGYGSKYFSSQLNVDEIVAMLNIEMIGKPSKEGKNSAWITGWNKSDLGEILESNVKGIAYTFYADPYPKQNLFYRSDNATLARLGVPAHSISTTQIDIDKDYHQVSDEVETLDIDNIANTINAIALGVQGIVDGKQTPSRIDPEDVK